MRALKNQVLEKIEKGIFKNWNQVHEFITNYYSAGGTKPWEARESADVIVNNLKQEGCVIGNE